MISNWEHSGHRDEGFTGDDNLSGEEEDGGEDNERDFGYIKIIINELLISGKFLLMAGVLIYFTFGTYWSIMICFDLQSNILI